MNDELINNEQKAATDLSERDNLFIRTRAKITLPIALMILIFLAGIIVVVGFSIYWNDGNRKYDIARGNKETKNQALSVEDGTTDRTSPVDAGAVKNKLDFLDKEVKALNNMSSFDPADISNVNLQLITPDQPSL